MVAFFAPVEGGLDRDPDPARAFLPSVAGCFELARFGLAFWTSVPPSEVVAAEAEGADGDGRKRLRELHNGGPRYRTTMQYKNTTRLRGQDKKTGNERHKDSR